MNYKTQDSADVQTLNKCILLSHHDFASLPGGLCNVVVPDWSLFVTETTSYPDLPSQEIRSHEHNVKHNLLRLLTLKTEIYKFWSRDLVIHTERINSSIFCLNRVLHYRKKHHSSRT
jgi:hypothetical protein